jgi:ribosomal-protein-alanine N-acetyltransferase
MLELQSQRLLVRDFAEGDWALVHALSREPAVTRYQAWMRVASEAEARQWAKNAVHHNQLVPRRAYNTVLIEHDTAQTVGWLGWGLREGHEHSHFSFGYAMLPSHWGRGYMTEAVCLALDFMFTQLGTLTVQSECASSNRASARVLEKAGLVLVERWHEHDEETGQSQEELRYRITLDEWGLRLQ